MLGVLNMKYKPDRFQPLRANHQVQLTNFVGRETKAEVKTLRTELETTKKELKVQMARCRHLVAAFTRKLAERDEEIKSSRELRDKQLSSVLRALIMLEARLKKEQKSIRIQLAEKDNIINNQQLEIDWLRSFVKRVESNKKEETLMVTELEEEPMEKESFIGDRECYAKPDLITSLGIDGENRLVEGDSPTPSLRYDSHLDSSLSSDTVSTRSCLGGDTSSDSDFPVSAPSQHSKALIGVHDRSAFSPINRRSKNHYNSVKTNGGDDFDQQPKRHDFQLDNQGRTIKNLPSALLQEVRIGSRSGDQDEYQDNPVLQCVNQILLKDQEDFLEEQRSLRLRALESGRAEDGPIWLTEGDCEDLPSPEENVVEAVKRVSSPGKIAALNNQEKTCLTMSNRLSLARMPDLEQSELEQEPIGIHQMTKKSISLTDLSKNKLLTRPNPPLPPKPNRLPVVKRIDFADKRIIRPTTVEFHNPPMVLPPPQPVVIDTTEMNKQPSLSLSILEPIDHGQDNELYVISNSALDDDIVRQLQGRSLHGSGLDITLNPQRLGGDAKHNRTQHSKVPNGLLHPNHKPKNKDLPNNVNLFLSNNGLFTSIKENGEANGIHRNSKMGDRDSFPFNSPPKPGLVNAIKMASPVAVLLTTGKAQESPEIVRNDISPSVSQMVRRFEDLGTTTTKAVSPSIEETATTSIKADDCSSIAASDDKESVDSDSTTSVSYDNFLEATGLSQKSIMTPSRMLSNHKSVLKPKDVKHRSRIKAAAIIEKVIPPQVVGPTIKYWTEPYL